MSTLSTTFKKLKNIEADPLSRRVLIKNYLACELFAQSMILMFGDEELTEILPDAAEGKCQLEGQFILDNIRSISHFSDALGNKMSRWVVEQILNKGKDLDYISRELIEDVDPGFLFPVVEKKAEEVVINKPKKHRGRPKKEKVK